MLKHNKTKEQLELLDYYQRPEISYSDLSMFRKTGYEGFKNHYTKRDRLWNSDSSEAMQLGSMVHCMILEPEEYYTRYRVGGTYPDASSQMGKMFKLVREAYEEDMCRDEQMERRELYLQCYTDSRCPYKISFDKVLDKMIEAGIEDYLQEHACVEKHRHEYVSHDLYNKADRIKASWDKTSKLKGFPFDISKFTPEIPLFAYPEAYPDLGMKGKLDALYIDETTGEATILDIKTMGDIDILTMKEKFIERGYIYQLSYYSKLVQYNYNIPIHKIKRAIIAVRTYYPYNIVCFTDIEYDHTIDEVVDEFYNKVCVDITEYRDVYVL